jgi:hypothetical protein
MLMNAAFLVDKGREKEFEGEKKFYFSIPV